LECYFTNELIEKEVLEKLVVRIEKIKENGIAGEWWKMIFGI